MKTMPSGFSVTRSQRASTGTSPCSRRWRAGHSAEEIDRWAHYRYLIGGEAFDWLLLAERLIEELPGRSLSAERYALLFHGHPPIEIDEEEFQLLIGTPKYQAYLNYLYGVTVEEALQLAVEEEIAKEHHGHVWAARQRGATSLPPHLRPRPQPTLLAEFAKERKLDATDSARPDRAQRVHLLAVQVPRPDQRRRPRRLRHAQGPRDPLPHRSHTPQPHRPRALDLEANAIPA